MIFCTVSIGNLRQKKETRRYYPNPLGRVWRYRRGNHNPYIEEAQTTQWPKEKYKTTNNDLQNIHIKIKIK